MSAEGDRYATVRLTPEDVASGFACGQRALDDYFARHALANDAAGIGRAYVLRSAEGAADQPRVLGFYTLSMASVEAATLARALRSRLPRYPMPVALIGRLAVDGRVQGQRLGERLLVDALRRVVDAADLIACLGVIVDAKDERAERFYGKYDFVTVVDEAWPRRMFLPIGVARLSLAT